MIITHSSHASLKKIFFTHSLKMTKKKELTITERGIIIGFHKAGLSERVISEKTGHLKMTIHDTITIYNKRDVLTSTSQSG